MIVRYGDIAEALADRGEMICPFRGCSMLPMLRQDRDAVHLKRHDGKGLNAADLPLYLREDGTPVLHRVLKVGKTGYLVCGDSCVEGEWIRPEQVIGIAVGYLRDGEYRSCTDPDYLRYAKGRVRNRRLALLWARLRSLGDGKDKR